MGDARRVGNVIQDRNREGRSWPYRKDYCNVVIRHVLPFAVSLTEAFLTTVMVVRIDARLRSSVADEFISALEPAGCVDPCRCAGRGCNSTVLGPWQSKIYGCSGFWPLAPSYTRKLATGVKG